MVVRFRMTIFFRCVASLFINRGRKKGLFSRKDLFSWAITDSNRRPSACKADALNQLS